MRYGMLLSCLVLLGASACGTETRDMEAEILTVMSAQQDAWNRGDIETFMQGYWRSPEVLFASRGTFAEGWEPLLERYKNAYPDGGMGKLEFSEVHVRPINDDYAWVTGKWALTMDDGDPHGAFTLIFRLTDDGWRIIHDHSSGVPPESENSN